MRLSLLSGVLLVAGCAGSPIDNTAAIDRACSVEDCFLERDVRDFEVIDQTTLIVFVGSQRCVFKVELLGTACDLTFAPTVNFRSPSDSLANGGSRPRDDIFGSNLGDRGLRVCENDLQIDVEGGAFTERPLATQQTDSFGNPRDGGVSDSQRGERVDRFGDNRAECRVTGVASLTDDQLIELYVARGLVPPPPPMGSGEIEVGEQEEGDSRVTPTGTDGEAAPTASQSSIPAPLAATAANTL